MKLSEPQRKFLEACKHPDGVAPYGSQHRSAYALADKGLIARDLRPQPYRGQVFLITDEGRRFLEEQS